MSCNLLWWIYTNELVFDVTVFYLKHTTDPDINCVHWNHTRCVTHCVQLLYINHSTGSALSNELFSCVKEKKDATCFSTNLKLGSCINRDVQMRQKTPLKEEQLSWSRLQSQAPLHTNRHWNEFKTVFTHTYGSPERQVNKKSGDPGETMFCHDHFSKLLF